MRHSTSVGLRKREQPIILAWLRPIPTIQMSLHHLTSVGKQKGGTFKKFGVLSPYRKPSKTTKATTTDTWRQSSSRGNTLEVPGTTSHARHPWTTNRGRTMQKRNCKKISISSPYFSSTRSWRRRDSWYPFSDNKRKTKDPSLRDATLVHFRAPKGKKNKTKNWQSFPLNFENCGDLPKLT